jgi:hypothetical protein
MRAWSLRRWGALLASAGALHCGADASSTLIVSEQTRARLAGRFALDGHEIEFAAQAADTRAGSVQLRMGALTYDLRYDFEAHDLEARGGAGREVLADGYGAAIDRGAPRVLRAAIDDLTGYLGPTRPESPLQEQMLIAGLQLLHDSGGMPLERTSFPLGPKELTSNSGSVAAQAEADVEKSLDDDGIRCVKSGESYFVSFDYGDSTVIDDVVQAGSYECNGQCGPTCTQLQPWRMWTLDCLEHDSCCNVTSTDSCWTPLGECGDEYDAAMGDFLRGFDPFRKHCGG